MDVMQLLAYAQTAFTVWMLVDVYRRGAEGFWFWVILFLPGLGAWVYFFAVKAPDFRLGRGLSLSWPSRGPSLHELRYRAENTPTLTNHLALAERLAQQGDHDEALPHLEEVLKREADHGQALFLLATCHAHSAEPARALPLLEKLLARDRSWGNYAAWYLLIDTKEECGDLEGALTTCRELTRFSPTLRHQCLLAEHLLAGGHKNEAADLMSKALDEHRYAPSNIRWRNRKWAAEAKRLWKRSV